MQEEEAFSHLPQLHLDGAVELHESRLEMHRLTLRVVQVDGALLMLVLVNVAQVHPQLQGRKNSNFVFFTNLLPVAGQKVQYQHQSSLAT